MQQPYEAVNSVPVSEPPKQAAPESTVLSPGGPVMSSSESPAGSKRQGVRRRLDAAQETRPPISIEKFHQLHAMMTTIGDNELDLDDLCSAVDDVDIIRHRIMRDARSVRAGRVTQVERLKHAIAMLGLNRVRRILTETVGLTFDDETEPHEHSRVSA